MKDARIAIIGAGLAGLQAASRLEQRGIRDFVVLEGDTAVGGRIAFMHASGAVTAAHEGIDFVDLGATWFWPDHQPQLDSLVQSLGIERFEQHQDGDTVLERSPGAVPMRVPGDRNAARATRVAGGMGALVRALRERVDSARIFTGEAVRRLRLVDGHVEVASVDRHGRQTTWRAEHVLLALPPRLAMHAIEFTPPLPAGLARDWRATATWMAPHAKYVAVYDRPFWREQGLSGEARSTCGPLVEIHDASMPGGSAGLFGFIGIPARVRLSIEEPDLSEQCRAQLVRLFGPQAASPKVGIIKDWARSAFTATPADLDAAAHQMGAPVTHAADGPWRDRLTGIASEWSRQFPGYVAGAIDAANRGLQSLLAAGRG